MKSFSLFSQWSYVVPPDPFYRANFLVDHNYELYFATNGDIHKSTENGNSWINLSNKFINNQGNSNHFIEFTGNNIFVASTLAGVFVSPDNGSSLKMDTTGLNSGTWSTQINLLYTDVSRIFTTNRMISVDNNFFIACDNGVYESKDFINNWLGIDQGFATWNQFGTTPIMRLYSDGSSIYGSMGKDDSAYVSIDMVSSRSDISDGLDHYIKSFSNYGGQLFAAQGNIDSSIIVYGGATTINDELVKIPEEIQLQQNYPNPFNSTKTISYIFPECQFVTIKVYNVLGEVLTVLVNENKNAGTHSISFDESNFSSGVYLYQIQTANTILNRKRMVIK